MRITVSSLAVLALLGVTDAASSTPRPRRPTATVVAVAIRVAVPGRPVAETAPAPATGGRSDLASFVDPGDGSIVVAAKTDAASTVTPGTTAAASGVASADNVSLFDGEITAASVSSRAAASATGKAAGGSRPAAGVVGLQALGGRIGRGTVALGDWGTLTVGARTHVATARPGARAFSGSIAGVELTLVRAHDGLPAGTVIELALVQVDAATPPPPPARPAPTPPQAVPGDRPQLLPPTTGPLVGVPQVISPPLGTGTYVFPVDGRAAVDDDFGTPLPGTYAHGVDIIGQLGEPVIAAAAGTLYDVGWDRIDGNRLWIRDRWGDEFSYAHLSAFSALTANGARVSAGQVIGFMGDTGTAYGLPSHLTFELRPVSLLYLGGEGAVDPTPYLAAWQRVSSVALTPGPGWAPSVPGTIHAPEPGAYLVTSSVLASLPTGASHRRSGSG
jgi:murein DD-endopeptidase MepM/ murein hydrolase activator NlpD